MVYVDGMRADYGRMVMCHMIADTTIELLEMADRIGLNRKYLQHEGQPSEHFDISLTKRRLALKAGARLIARRDLVALIRSKRAGN